MAKAKGGFLTMGTKRVGLARIQALVEGLRGRDTVNRTDGKGHHGYSELGLALPWIFNFGAEQTHTAASAVAVTTPHAKLINLALVLEELGEQSSVVSVAQGTRLFGETAVVGTDVVIGTAGAAPIPDDLEIVRLTGNLASTVTYTAAAANHQSGEFGLIIFTGNVMAASSVLTFVTHTTAGLDAESSEVLVSGAGDSVFTRATVPTDADESIILTASGADTTILPGSYLYFYASHNTDTVGLKACLRTTGGTIAVTFT
jgi:hypothetical protein